MLNTDAADIATARASYNARATESSIIAWTLSPEWTDVRPYATYGTRGSVKGSCSYGCDSGTAAGEITNAR